MSDRQKVISMNHVYMFIVYFFIFLFLFFDFVSFINIFLFAYLWGLGNVVEHLLPYAKHQFCVRHLYANIKGKEFKGKAFKDELWAVA